MCTAISYKNHYHYFGRTLDLECSYKEQVVITPRSFVFNFKNGEKLYDHYAIIGMATVSNNYPLYYEATNEKGLSIAGLNFPDNAYYPPLADSAVNIAPFELIPLILGKCQSIKDAKQLLKNINIANINFSDEYKVSPLHWMISDANSSIAVEPLKSGLKIHDNPVGVLTNNPPFDWHMTNLGNYINLSPKTLQNRFSNKLELIPYSRGMGAMGLPGDVSSASRFVRTAFNKLNSVCLSREDEISQFFHILGSVEQIKGCVDLGDGKYEITVYTSCCNTDKGIYYYTTYNNSQITAVDMRNEDLNSKDLICYPLILTQQIKMQN